MKILVVPHYSLIERPRTESPWIRLNRALGRPVPLFGYHAELLYWADLPRVAETYVLGNLWPHLHSREIPKYCPWPSMHGTPKAHTVLVRELDSTIRQMDAVLVSCQAWDKHDVLLRDTAIRFARKHSKPVGILDCVNHEDIYHQPDYAEQMLRGFKPGRDFDVYFKDDLMRGYGTDRIVSVTPTPVRPEVYAFAPVDKDISVFYSGRARAISQPEREKAAKLCREQAGSRLLEHESSGHFLSVAKHNALLNRAWVALCPSGRVWSGWRYALSALAESVVLAPRPYTETVGPPLSDGANSILYDVEWKAGGYHVKDKHQFRERLTHFLGQESELALMADQWKRSVLAGHTTLARAQFIKHTLENVH